MEARYQNGQSQTPEERQRQLLEGAAYIHFNRGGTNGTPERFVERLRDLQKYFNPAVNLR